MTINISSSSIRAVTTPAEATLSIAVERNGPWSRASISNPSAVPVRVQEIRLFESGPHPATCRLYGEGFQMLSQYAGTIESSTCLSPYSDREHYRLPAREGQTVFYQLLHLELAKEDHLLIAFSACHRFSGELRLSPGGLVAAVLDTEGLELSPGESWALEEIGVLQGPDAADLYQTLARRLAQNHAPRDLSLVPTGWCSWYCFGPDLTEEDVGRNLATIQQQKLDLKFVQIDDGFQAKMGDWTTWAPGFPDGLKSIVSKIRDAGCEPAIWLAPFIAEKTSEILLRHPEWFIADEKGRPLSSDQVTFGGWRCGPWFCLDGTHPGAQKHLTEMARTLREKFGCHYFKLDALFWGAIHGGRLHDPRATRIEAYRRGLAAFCEGAGTDSYILGCNAPLWPSLGLVNGMRVTADVIRSWETIESLARQQFFRNWQHRVLWVNDPDCVCLENGTRIFPSLAELHSQGVAPATPAEFDFHAAVILASGGALLAGDDISALPAKAIEVLKSLLRAPRTAARFRSFDFDEGAFEDAQGNDWRIYFNWSNAPKSVELPKSAKGSWQLLWSGDGIRHENNEGRRPILHLPAHSAAVFETVFLLKANSTSP